MATATDIERMKARTKAFAVTVVRFYAALPKSTAAQVLGRQLLRSGTSVGAQYREACRAKSDADFISKVEGCLQELEETAYWLEIIVGAGILQPEATAPVMGETRQLTAIFTTVVRRVKARRSTQ